MVIEADIENFLVREVERRGGVAEKVTVIGQRGFFDRLVLLPGNWIAFVECKRPKGGVLSPHQRLRIQLYQKLGARVRVCATRDEVSILMSEYDTTPQGRVGVSQGRTGKK